MEDKRIRMELCQVAMDISILASEGHGFETYEKKYNEIIDKAKDEIIKSCKEQEEKAWKEGFDECKKLHGGKHE